MRESRTAKVYLRDPTAATELRAALARIVEADDTRREANASGQHASPISYWIPTEEAIEAARELLSRV